MAIQPSPRSGIRGLRIGVTGSSGFIGTEVVRQLRVAGAEVCLISRVDATGGPLLALCENLDGLVHLAAPTTDIGHDNASAALDFTRQVFAALPSRPLRIVIASSLAVYVPPQDRESLSEVSPTYADSGSSDDAYVRMKSAQDDLIRVLCTHRPCTLTMIRPSNVWSEARWAQPCVGPKAGPLWFVVAPSRALRLTHVRNCASAFVAALSLCDGTTRVLNVDDQAETSAWYFATHVVSWRQHGYLPIPLSKPLFDALMRIGLGVVKILRPGRRVPGLLRAESRAARLGAFSVDSTSARRALFWFPDLLPYRRVERDS